MALELTSNQFVASQQQTKLPNIVFQIDGVDTLFGTVAIKEEVRIGDPGLEIGDPELNSNAFYIGGFKEILDQKKIIDLDTTSKNIRQTLNQDLGEGNSISAFKVGLIDDGTLIDLITPGTTVTDVLGRKCRIWFTLNKDSTSFPDDYVVVFRGIVTEINTDPGKVIFSLNHPDNKKKKNIFKIAEGELASGISSGASSITLVDASDFLSPITGPDATISDAFEAYALIENEIIRYTGISTNTLTGVTRGQFGTTPSSHSSGTQISSRYRLTGNAMDLALQLMASGFNGNFVSDVAVRNFNVITATENVSNSIRINGSDFDVLYNVQIGDYITTTGATNGANNVSLKQVIDLVTQDDYVYLIIDGVSFVDEVDTSATVAFRSQYDVLPDGFGMTNDEIDIEEHLRLQSLFLSSFDYDFLLKETIDGKEWLEKQIYSPIACYSLPRKSQASVGYHIGPIPGQDIKTFNETNILNPDKIAVKRSTNRNFYNEVVYAWEPALLEDKYTRGKIYISSTSKNQIDGGAKTLTIQSQGLSDALAGESIANSQSSRRLDRYQFGAESFDIQTTFGSGFAVEIGDILIFDGTNLQVADIKTGSRGMESRLFECTNKSLALDGTVTLSILDTSFDGSARRGLISPSSIISNGLSTTEFVIQQSFGSRFASDEYRKWNGLIRPAVRIRNADFSFDEKTVITSVTFNTITVSPALSVAPTAGYIMEFAPYDDVNTTDQQKLIYAYMRDTDFVDGGTTYKML